MEEDGDAAPSWPPSASSRRRAPPSPSSPLLSPTFLIILLPLVALLIVYFAVSPFVVYTSQILRPNAVKKSWDSLNISLVLFAIICGILARNRNDDEALNPAPPPPPNVPVTASPKLRNFDSNRWFDYSDQIYNPRPPPLAVPASGGVRLRRSSSSYPDLRQVESMSESREDRLRFFDDFEVSSYYRSYGSTERGSVRDHSRRRRSGINSEDCDDIKVIPVDTFVARPIDTSGPPPPPPAPPPLPPPPLPAPPSTSHQNPKRTYQSRPHQRVTGSSFEEVRPSAPPPPPPPPPVAPGGMEQSYRKFERRKGGAKREIAHAIASLYNQRKRKRKNKTKHVFEDSWIHPHPSSGLRQPPPPPPPSVFDTLFRKGSTNKRVHSVSPPPPPPPPPPLRHNTSPAHSSRKKRPIPPPPPAPPTPPPEYIFRRKHVAASWPPLPARMSGFYERDEDVNSGGQSPLIPMPPPPPPPFRMAELRFVVQKGYVRIESAQSSCSGSPELDGVEGPESTKVNEMNGADTARSAFCPSPDVNTKADTFIARLRDGWRLEKINSMREKQKTDLGSGPRAAGPSPIKGET